MPVNEEFINSNLFFGINKFDSLKQYVSDYSSPVFLYSKNVITSQYNALHGILPRNCGIFYAQKSNPNAGILKHIHSLGAGCDTASIGEIKSALEAGFRPDEIMFTGPGKREDEIKFAIDTGVLSINVESVQELYLIDRLSADCGKKQNILLRINPPFESGETTKIIGGTGVSKFGIDSEQLEDFFCVLCDMKNVSLKGIHIFNSSQILNWNRIYENTKNVIDTAKELSSVYGYAFSHIDLGGGFGLPYKSNETPLDLISLGSAINELVTDAQYKSFLCDVKLIFEPGRFLSGLSGIYLTKVLYTKQSRGKNIAIIDGGVHHLLRPALIGQPHPVCNLTGLIERRKGSRNYMVSGPLCTSLDCFDENAELCDTNPGDVLAVLNAGAYGYTESMPLFLSHPPAREIIID